MCMTAVLCEPSVAACTLYYNAWMHGTQLLDSWHFQLILCNVVSTKGPEMHVKTTKIIFSNISVHYKCQNKGIHDLAGYFWSNSQIFTFTLF